MIRVLAPLSTLMTLIWVFPMTRYLPRLSWITRQIKNEVKRNYLFVIPILCIASFQKISLKQFISGTSHLNPMGVLGQIIAGSTLKPAVFLVGNFAWYGLAFFLIALFWKKILTMAQQWGVGALLACILAGGFSINPAARQNMYLFPFMCILLFQTMDRIDLSKRQFFVLVGLAIFLSRIWYPLPIGSFNTNFYTFPGQHFYMHHGGYLNIYTYVAQAILGTVAFLTLYFTLRKDPRDAPSNEPSSNRAKHNLSPMERHQTLGL